MVAVVTGGAGFLGRHLVDQLMAAGHAVRIVDIALGEAMPAGVEVVRASVTDAAAMRRALAGAEHLYHMAANANLWARRKAVFEEVNHQGTRIVLDCAARLGVGRIVVTTSEAIRAGTAPPERPRLAAMAGPYCRAKLLAENAALIAAREGQPVVIVSPTLPVGPGDARLTPPTRMILDFLKRATPAYLDCAMNLVDARDVAAFHMRACEEGETGRIYVAANETMGLGELLALLEKLSGRRLARRRAPYPLALVAAAVSEFVADHLTHRPPMAPLTGVRLARMPPPRDPGRDARTLGVPLTPIATTLADLLAWFEETGLLARR